jgi:hypothetical protein
MRSPLATTPRHVGALRATPLHDTPLKRGEFLFANSLPSLRLYLFKGFSRFFNIIFNNHVNPKILKIGVLTKGANITTKTGQGTPCPYGYLP